MRFSTRSLCFISALGILFGLFENHTLCFAQARVSPIPSSRPYIAPTPTPDPSPSTVSESTSVQSITLWKIIKKAGWMMVPLGLLSLGCAFLIFEGFSKIRLIHFAPPGTVQQLRTAFADENFQEAWRVCKSKASFLTHILSEGLERIGKGSAVCKEIMSEHNSKESFFYRTKVSHLFTVGLVSLMTGFFGAVVGMIKVFARIAVVGMADVPSLAEVMSGSLAVTAIGLLVAISAFFFYYFLSNRLQEMIVLAESLIHELMVDVKYEELQGIKVGESMETELTQRATASGVRAAASEQREPEKQISQAITGVTIECPQCRFPIITGVAQCQNCGAELQWI